MKKVSIIGAGRVGENVAVHLAARDICEQVVLLDIRGDMARGVALDIAESAQILQFGCKVTGGDDYALLADSDMIVVTAGFPRKPGMSRSDVLDANIGIIDGIAEAAVKHAPGAMMLIVSNPVDTLTYRAWQKTGWPRERVIGQAGVLDSSRMATFLAEETGLAAQDITTLVLGGHGDTMVPLPRFSTVNGVPVTDLVSESRLAEIIQRTRDGGAEVLGLRQNSSAYDAPGAAVTVMVDSIARGLNRLIPTVAILQGEYNQNDIAMGVPCVLGRGGIERIIELNLDKTESADFSRSADAIRKDLESVKGS